MREQSTKIISYSMEMDSGKRNVLVAEGSYESDEECWTNPEMIYHFLVDEMHLNRKSEENIVMLALSSKARPLGVFMVGHGTVNQACITPREVFSRLLLINGTGFILAHNHPSGVAAPSDDDRSTTRRLKVAGEEIGLQLLDHIVVGEDNYYSFAEHEWEK